jgi:glycosyltransferase involved in cell wall biosynthesis
VKVLISAYACEPGRGSEPGAGWNWATAAAVHHDVWVVTRANNRAVIEAELRRRPVPRLRFVYVDLPEWSRRWKRGNRGARAYYVLWQLEALRRARRLQRRIAFDVVHHLTFANMWLPALACFTGPPFVLGPVGGGTTVPLHLYPELGVGGAIREAALRGARFASLANPLVRSGWRRARAVIAQNAETSSTLERRTPAPVVVHPHSSVDPDRLQVAVRGTRRSSRPLALYAGRLVPFKGVSLVIRSLVELPGWTLEIVGSGPDERRLRRLAVRLGVDSRVAFVGWKSQEELWRRLAEATALVAPSLRDEAPLIFVEAMTIGTPVVGLDHAGPRAIAARAPGQRIRLVGVAGGHQVSREIARALQACRTSPAPGPRPLPLNRSEIVETLDSTYHRAVLDGANGTRRRNGAPG